MSTIKISKNGEQNVALGHGISVNFPEGFIDEDEIVFNYAVNGVVEFGPLSLPNHKSQLISAILSLHPEKNGKFKKPISITIPHKLYIDNEQSNGIKFCKAEVNSSKLVDGQNVIDFKEVSAHDHVTLFSRPTQIEEYGEVKEFCATLETLHTCHYCLSSDDFHEFKVFDRTQFFIVEIKPLNLGISRNFSISYSVVEFNSLCQKVGKGGFTQYTIISFY